MMTRYRVIFQDSGKDSRRSDTTYIRLLVWGGEKYVGAWFGLLNRRATLRYLGDPDEAARYTAMAPIALASTIKDAIESGQLDAPRDVPLHPTQVLSLASENHEWNQGDEVLIFDA
jgi:hypothetical protein